VDLGTVIVDSRSAAGWHIVVLMSIAISTGPFGFYKILDILLSCCTDELETAARKFHSIHRMSNR